MDLESLKNGEDEQSKYLISFWNDYLSEKTMAEELMREWVGMFLEEIEKIDNFFNSKFAEYC